MSNAPKRIWLQDDGDYKGAQAAIAEITWCVDQINEGDTEYTRSDLCDPMQDPRVQALVKAAKRYADRYCRDEADDPEICTTPEQHEDAKALFAALRALEQGDT